MALRLLGAAALLALLLAPATAASAARQGVVGTDGMIDCVYAVVASTESLTWRIDRIVSGVTTSFFFTTVSPGGEYDRCGSGPDCGVGGDLLVTLDLWARGAGDDGFKLVRSQTFPCLP